MTKKHTPDITQAILHLPVEVLTQSWSPSSICNHLETLSMRGYPCKTLAHKEFLKEIRNNSRIDYEACEIVVPMQIDTLYAVFKAVKSQSDIVTLFRNDFVTHLSNKQMLASDGKRLSKQARIIAVAKKVSVEFK